ncbi:hypothetical protein CPC16_003053 [Podila verticillata]|nr:hypothetical protein CPC16_003053 [Podila verticillata]KFH66612.1 hypothetical protein MVEG_07137 [Podila verticillata NRRL 6337]
MAFPSLLSDHEQKAFSQFVTQLAKEENARNQQLRSQQYSSEWSSLSQQQQQPLQYQTGHDQQLHQHHQQAQVLPSQNGPVPSAGAPSMTLPLPTDTHSLQLALAQHQRDWIHQISTNPLLAPGGTIDPHAMSQAILQNPELMAQANAITQAMVLAQQQQQQQHQQQMLQQRQYSTHGSGRDTYEPYHHQQHPHPHHQPQQQYPMKQEPLSPRSVYPSGSHIHNHHDRSRSITPPSVPSQNGYHSSSTSPKGQYELGYGYPQLPPPVPNYHGEEYVSPKARKGSSSSSMSNDSPLSPGQPKYPSREQYHHQYDERLEDALAKDDHNQAPGTTGMTNKTGKKQELLTDAEKKANHIASEQKRRQNIRIGFDSLVDIVPSLSDCHRSEALILQKSVDYIQRLLHQKNQLKNKVRDLQSNLGESIDDEDSGTEMDI